MAVCALHHVNFRVSAVELQLLRAFYCDVVGLTVEWRPPFKSVGYWLYANGTPVVHLVQSLDVAPAVDGKRPSGFNHIAFRCSDLELTLRKLEDRGIPFKIVGVPESAETQVVITDPLGFDVELNFLP